MDIEIDVAAFLAALGAVSGVTPARSPKPILGNILCEINAEAGSTVMATDLELGVRIRLLGARASEPARLVLPPERVKQILSLAKDQNDTLTLTANGARDQIRIRGKECRYDLPLEDPDLFPDVPDFSAADYDEVAAGDLARLIKRTIYATDVDSTRYSLGGVMFEFGDGTLRAVATDGRRLALQTVESASVGAGALRGNTPVIPVKALKVLEKLIDETDPPVHVTLGGGVAGGGNPTFAMFRGDSFSLYTRLVEGRFPRYSDVIDAAGVADRRASFECRTLLSAFRQAAITTSEESRGVDCTFDSGGLVIEGQGADRGASRIECPLAFDGAKTEITFDPRYLTEALQSVDPKTAMVMRLTDGKNAALLETECGLRVCVMPLTK